MQKGDACVGEGHNIEVKYHPPTQAVHIEENFPDLCIGREDDGERE